MAKLESNLINMVLVLTGISLFAAVALGSVYSATQAPIEASKTAKQQNAIKDVLPAFERLNDPEAIEVTGIGSFDIYKAFDSNDNFVGAAVESISKNGFSGEIKIMVGFDRDGNIVNYSVLEQKETPGLGTKMVDWFKPQGKVEKSLIEKLFGFEVQKEERKSSIIGMNPAKNKISVTKDGGEIDAITAATISSRAFLEAVQYAYAAYANNPEAVVDINSGATAVSESADTNTANTKTDAESKATTNVPESDDTKTNTESKATTTDSATTDAASAASSTTQTDGTSSATTAVDTTASKDAN